MIKGVGGAGIGEQRSDFEHTYKNSLDIINLENKRDNQKSLFKTNNLAQYSNISRIQFSTYIGGDGSDRVNQMHIDAEENIYLSGSIFSSDFPTKNAFDDTYGGGQENEGDGFLAKISSTGTLLLSTYIGGNGSDSINQMHIDAEENIYLSGSTSSSDFPTKNAFDDTYGGGDGIGDDGFLAKISNNGTLLFSTFIGGNSSDSINQMHIDAEENIYLSGSTSSSDFPTKNAFSSTLAGGGCYTFPGEGFLTKFSPNGSLVFSTYIGGTDCDFIYEMFVDAMGNMYLRGVTDSTDFPTKNAFDDSYGGGNDGFLAKFAPNGTLLFSTYIGGALGDWIDQMSLDNTGNIYLSGVTDSTDFPTKNAFDDNYGGEGDSFLSKFAPNGTLLFSTYIGGALGDWIDQMSLDNTGNIYLSGETESTDFPTKNAFDDSYGGGNDGFLAKFAPNGTLLFSTYVGGTLGDGIVHMSLDNTGNIYLSGSTGLIKIKVFLDLDSDGMDDDWELFIGYDLTNDGDPDGDGLNNYLEYTIGTSPVDFDTDGDGMDDGYEYHNNLNPRIADGHLDPDHDWVSNLEEYHGGTDPFNIFSFPILSINIIYVSLLVVTVIFVLSALLLLGTPRLTKYKERIQASNLFNVLSVWKSDFADYPELLRAKLVGAASREEYQMVVDSRSPNFGIACEIQDGNFDDYELYLEAKAVGASTLEEYQLVLKYQAPDYETALTLEQEKTKNGSGQEKLV